jgi:poly-gamma-glutamate synthesis protein (capsule biosynthesis protein)
VLFVALVVPVLAACSTITPQPGAPSTPATPDAAATAPPTPERPAEVTLTFGGDVHFAGRTLKLLDEPATAFGPVSEIFRASDVAMINLETAVTTRGTPQPKRFHFRAPADAYASAAEAGIDVVSLANNHTLDYGQVGLADTLDWSASAGVPAVGAGRNAKEAYAPWITTVHGVKIAFLGISQIAELSSSWAAQDNRPGLAYAFNAERSVKAVQAAKASADVVVVFMHWGVEYNDCPTGAMKTFAKRMADAGASLIVGAHAHNLLGDGWLGNTFVQYGLGNFLWWYNDAGSNDTGVLRVTLTGSKITKTEFLPAYIDRTTGQPIPSEGTQKDRIARKYAGLRGCTGLKAGSAG